MVYRGDEKTVYGGRKERKKKSNTEKQSKI
jgi:hypothetical protein